MTDQLPKHETMSIEEVTYDTIKDQTLAKQQSPRDRSGVGRGIEMNH